jgi:hypothetical protein
VPEVCVAGAAVSHDCGNLLLIKDTSFSGIDAGADSLLVAIASGFGNYALVNCGFEGCAGDDFCQCYQLSALTTYIYKCTFVDGAINLANEDMAGIPFAAPSTDCWSGTERTTEIDNFNLSWTQIRHQVQSVRGAFVFGSLDLAGSSLHISRCVLSNFAITTYLIVNVNNVGGDQSNAMHECIISQFVIHKATDLHQVLTSVPGTEVPSQFVVWADLIVLRECRMTQCMGGYFCLQLEGFEHAPQLIIERCCWAYSWDGYGAAWVGSDTYNYPPGVFDHDCLDLVPCDDPAAKPPDCVEIRVLPLIGSKTVTLKKGVWHRHDGEGTLWQPDMQAFAALYPRME